MYFLIPGSKRVNPLSLKFLDYTFIYGLALDGDVCQSYSENNSPYIMCIRQDNYVDVPICTVKDKE